MNFVVITAVIALLCKCLFYSADVVAIVIMLITSLLVVVTFVVIYTRYTASWSDIHAIMCNVVNHVVLPILFGPYADIHPNISRCVNY